MDFIETAMFTEAVVKFISDDQYQAFNWR